MAPFDSKFHLISSVCQQIYSHVPLEDKNLDIFAQHFFKRVPIEFLQKMQVAEIVSITQEAWKLFQVRQPEESLVKIMKYQLSHHMMPRLGIFMINLDQPFLIDSITIFLEKKGFKTELVVHPVLGVERTKEGQLVSLIDLKETHPSITSKADEFSSHDMISPLKIPSTRAIPTQPESIAFIQIKSPLNQKKINMLRTEIHNLIHQVRDVVSDWPSMKGRLHALNKNIESLPFTKNFPSALERQDLQDFLKWLEHGNFVFLGSRYCSIDSSTPQKNKDLSLDNSSNSLHFGLFRKAEFSHNEDLVPTLSRNHFIAGQKKPSPEFPPESTLSITKTNVRSPVHRASRIDSIEVIDWDKDGQPKGLHQFIGIFTKVAFTGRAFDIPIIRRKVQSVFDQFGLAPQWHDGKTLISILNSIPRDELFYLDESQIYDISQNVLNMNDQRALTLAIRPDQYGRYATVMIFLPKEKYSVALKNRFYKILEHQIKGKISSDNVLLGELDYARLIFVVNFSKPTSITYSQKEIEKALLEAALSWENYLERLITSRYDEQDASRLLAYYQKSFPPTYVEEFKPEQAVTDIIYMEKIKDSTPIDLYLYQDKNHKTLKVKIFHARHSLSLSTLLPILQNLGLQIIGETSYSLDRDGYLIWIHDFEVESHNIENWRTPHANLISAFHHIWNGTAENDSLYQLILKAGLNVRQVTLIRAYLKFLRQVQLPYSWNYLEETLSYYAPITRNFVELFEHRFALKSSKNSNIERAHLLKDTYRLLEKVDRLDHDRILRRVLNAIEATVRTNYFQATALQKEGLAPYLSFKFDCRKLDDLPKPSPLYEIFIYSSRVEALHLRGAKVARGGIRWSDRLEDFRTEILGLMKAQTVKNSVIVPLGSKGGFVVKNQAKLTDPKQLAQEVIHCYQIMIRGMLDITDNLVKGKIVPPPHVVRLDEDDPYLVVAADKGTASFSDIANAISAQYNFWLDDAFASGGSTGYDHKKMAITARGVWESIKRHFGEIKHNIQTIPFTVVGVGDMAGDVFGNGMLQTSQIRLVAAFNHQHIFLDPTPNAKTSFQERKRLFEMPQSTWKDYNPRLISEGGGVFERSAKSIKLSSQLRKLIDVTQTEMSPDELIKRLLCLPVDLLYFGGIGTFIKASTETHTDVGDRSNNDIRVDGKFVQAQIIGEGANLGMTQRARIEFALKGGRLNTDAIDNSAGVDCSDHEVNLKILFRTVGKAISRTERNELLKKMTDDVAALVLKDNYRQTQILTTIEATKTTHIHTYQALLRILEIDVGLDRTLEALPNDETLEQRSARNQGMTRPELSVVLAYSKIALYEKILTSSLPDEAYYRSWLQGYFPLLIQKQFLKAIKLHPLRREITATVLANEIINRVGPSFIHEITQTCGVNDIDVVKAFFSACHVLELKKLWDQIDGLDDLMISDVQTQVLLDINQSLEQIILWFLRHPEIKHTHFTGLHTLLLQVPDKLQGDQQNIFNVRQQGFLHMGISPEIAQTFSMIPFFPALLDIMFLGKKTHNFTQIAQTYFTLQSKIQLDWLMLHAAQIHAESEWQRSARTILIDDLAQIQVKLTNQVMTESKGNNVDAWMQNHKDHIHHLQPIIANIKGAGHPDLGMLSYAMRQLERLI